MEPGSAPEWLPDELTNNGLRVAADPPPPPEARAGGADGRGEHAVTVDHVDRIVRERIAEIERRIESRLAAAVADLKRSMGRDGGDRRPAPDLLADFEGNGAESSRDGGSARPVLDGAVDSRLREAERRVARAAQATERNVDEVRRILGARLAASRWVSDPDNGSGR
jgi:hypothetical protein